MFFATIIAVLLTLEDKKVHYQESFSRKSQELEN